ncbi:LexA family protein [Halomonas denitrificans]|uniref:LexA family protein n=1 Tax=Halomonas denitrificans TaxID=370769 RepID=UPI001C99CF08|nr:translesion error-prone DNA polymerase V autoproteolytic subunit [Halomonas denitrificans]MBY5970575.1 translesion error-prone DNA polymerase V autoproteolytic subunit [Halomonas denitrificans]
MTVHLEVLGRVDERAPGAPLPLAAGEVRAGFPSPADDYLEGQLDLVAHLVPHPSSTFYLRAKGESMKELGIFDDDLLIVDRSLEPRQGAVLIASVDGELTCKQLGKLGDRPYLLAANEAYPPIALNGHDCDVWGVVTHSIHALPQGTSRRHAGSAYQGTPS